jgi:hypothetical protein
VWGGGLTSAAGRWPARTLPVTGALQVFAKRGDSQDMVRQYKAKLLEIRCAPACRPRPRRGTSGRGAGTAANAAAGPPACWLLRSDRLDSVECSHAWPHQLVFESEHAAFLVRQYAHANLGHRLTTRPFLSHLEKASQPGRADDEAQSAPRPEPDC